MEDFQNELKGLAEKYNIHGVLLIFGGDRKPIIVGNISPRDTVRELFLQCQSQNIFSEMGIDTNNSQLSIAKDN